MFLKMIIFSQSGVMLRALIILGDWLDYLHTTPGSNKWLYRIHAKFYGLLNGDIHFLAPWDRLSEQSAERLSEFCFNAPERALFEVETRHFS